MSILRAPGLLHRRPRMSFPLGGQLGSRRGVQSPPWLTVGVDVLPGSVVEVAPWVVPFPLCPRGVLPIHFPNAFLGIFHILLWGDVGERRIDLRASGDVLASQDLGCLRLWGSGVPVGSGRDIYLGGGLSGWRVAGGGRTRALSVGEEGRISARRGPRSVPTWGLGESRCRPGWQCPEKTVGIEMVVPVLHVVGRVGWRERSVVSSCFLWEVHPSR